MITHLITNNFLSHKHTEFTFVNGVNVLVGLSDSGKSAVMNALRWVLTNEPSGDSFRSWWSTTVDVTIIIDNTFEITRFRNEDGNGYSLRDITKDEEKSVFLAIKNGVPDEIAKILNIDETNIQTQLSTHFLLSSTPGEVAKHFNKVSKLDKIDLANANINSWINSINQEVKYKADELQKNTEKLESFDYLEKLEAEVEVLENMQNQLVNMQGNEKKLSRLIDKLEDVEFSIHTYQELLQAETPVNDLLLLFSKKKELETQGVKLNRLIKSIEAKQEEIKESEKIIPAGALIESTLALIKKSNDLQKEYKKLDNLVSAIQKVENNVLAAEITFENLHTKLDANMPSVCPFCEQKIK